MGPTSNRELLATRAAIIEYLKSRPSPKPVEPKNPGRVSVNFDQGYVVLVPEGLGTGDAIRLAFDKESRSREIAAGKYTVRRYVVENGEWAIWATGQGRKITVTAGQSTAIELDLAVQLKMNAGRHGAKANIGGSFQGDSGMGLSLLNGEARVVVGWAVGEASGDCAYG